VLTALTLVAVVLAVLHLAAQVAGGEIHRRRGHATRCGLDYLGPVSAIVPTRNQAATIEATVWSLARSDYPWLEIIVADDGSTDGTADIVERLQLPTVTVIRRPPGGGPPELRSGVRYALADLLVFVDAATTVERDAVGRIVQPFRDPDVAAVAGNTKVANRSGPLGRWQHVEYATALTLDRRMTDVARWAPMAPAAVAAVRRTAQSDTDDGDRLMGVAAAGGRVAYEPSAVARTQVPASLPALVRQRRRWLAYALGRHRRAGHVVLFQVLQPLTGPLVDAYAVYGLFVLPPAPVLLGWAGFTTLQAAVAAYALRLDREPYRALWCLPPQQIVYRQLMFLVVVLAGARWLRRRVTISARRAGRAR
jgi:hypothetical protein